MNDVKFLSFLLHLCLVSPFVFVFLYQLFWTAQMLLQISSQTRTAEEKLILGKYAQYINIAYRATTTKINERYSKTLVWWSLRWLIIMIIFIHIQYCLSDEIRSKSNARNVFIKWVHSILRSENGIWNVCERSAMYKKEWRKKTFEIGKIIRSFYWVLKCFWNSTWNTLLNKNYFCKLIQLVL